MISPEIGTEITDSDSPDATSMTRGHHKQKRKTGKTESQFFAETTLQNVTTGVQACIVLFVFLITYLCFSADFQLFTWHPLLLSFGFTFLMIEGILCLFKDNIFVGTLPKDVRVRLHWILETIALVLNISGFIVVYVNKNLLNKHHFVTWHALLGLTGIVCQITSSLGGVAALYHQNFKQIISPRVIKFLHIIGGTATFIIGGQALVLSVYTKWFETNTGGNPAAFLIGLILVTLPVFWISSRLVFTSMTKLRGFKCKN